MKKILIGLSLLCMSSTQLPNHNWINPYTISSPSLRVNFEGHDGSNYKYAVLNKQPCTVNFSLKIGEHYDTATIQAGKTKHFTYPAPFAFDTIWAKALTNCSQTYDTCYWGITTGGALAVRPKVHGVRLPDGSIRVTVEGENSGVVRYRVAGTDTWSEIALVNNTAIIKQ